MLSRNSLTSKDRREMDLICKHLKLLQTTRREEHKVKVIPAVRKDLSTREEVLPLLVEDRTKLRAELISQRREISKELAPQLKEALMGQGAWPAVRQDQMAASRNKRPGSRKISRLVKTPTIQLLRTRNER